MAQQESRQKASAGHDPAAPKPVVLSPFQAWVLRRVPALDSLRNYSWQILGADVTAGLTVATVAAPQAMAYATLAGLAPEFGLFTAIVMTGVGALFDSSRQLINGPTNAISIALLSALVVVPEGERIQAAVLLACLVGFIQLGIAFLHLGDLTRYVSPSVIVGFTFGAGTLLVLDQLKNLLGLHARGGPDDHFLKRFWLSLSEGGGIHWPTCLIGVGTIALVAALRGLNGLRRERGARFPLPQHLIAVVIMAALVWAFRLDVAYGVQIVGPVPASLPAFQPPQLNMEQTRLLASSAFAIAILGLLEAVAMAKSIAVHTGQKLDINQQCLSEGAANLIGSFFQCFPGSGSLTRSAVNQQAGAVTQWSGVFSAIGVAVIVLLFAPFAQYIPRAALAGLLMLAAFRMVDRDQLVFHLRATRFDAGVVLATALAAIFISVEFCIVIGVFLSFVLYVPRAAHVRLVRWTIMPDGTIHEREPAGDRQEQMLVHALEGELFFGGEPELEKLLNSIVRGAGLPVRVVVLALSHARNPDAAFLKLLKTFHGRLQAQDVLLLLCGVQVDLRKALTASGLDRILGPEHIISDSAGHGSSALEAVRLANEVIARDI